MEIEAKYNMHNLDITYITNTLYSEEIAKYNESIWKHLACIPVCKNTLFHHEIWEDLVPMTLLYAITDYIK